MKGRFDAAGHWPRLMALAAAMMLAFSLALGSGCGGSTSEDVDPLNQDETPEAANRRAARLVGTWRGRQQSPDAPFEFAGVTFAPDGTYTAHMVYEGEARGDSGKWRVEGGELVLAAGRRYELEFRGRDVVVFREPQTLRMVSLTRLK